MVSLLLLTALFQAQRVETDAGCIKCHENQAEDWRGSIHAPKAVGCVKCHGADSVDNRSKPHLFTAGFRRGTKRTNPAMCAECHLPEFKAFDAGAHGEDARDASGRVKGCVSCHAAHETAAAVRQVIVKENCGTCHRAGTEQMKWAWRYSELALRLPDDRLKEARIGQHGVSAAFLAGLEKPAGPPPPAYNTETGRPPLGLFAAVLGVLGAALGWITRGRGRMAA